MIHAPMSPNAALHAAPVAIGTAAPAFVLPSDRGGTLASSRYFGHHPVVLAFFPKAFTPG